MKIINEGREWGFKGIKKTKNIFFIIVRYNKKNSSLRYAQKLKHIKNSFQKIINKTF